jgi:hypothetical protein
MPKQPTFQPVDAIGHIRRQQQMYLRDGIARAEDLVERMLSDIVWLDALPAKVERAGSWWIVSSEKEWLMTLAGAVSLEVFRTIVPIPRRGPNDMRADVVVAAFARAVVTAGPEGVTWVVGDAATFPLPNGISLHRSSGRTVAFTLTG